MVWVSNGYFLAVLIPTRSLSPPFDGIFGRNLLNILQYETF